MADLFPKPFPTHGIGAPDPYPRATTHPPILKEQIFLRDSHADLSGETDYAKRVLEAEKRSTKKSTWNQKIASLW